MSLKRSLFSLILTALFLFVYPYFSIFKTPAFAASDLTNTWSSTLGLPATIASSVATSINGKLYFFGGANTSDFSQIRIPTSDSNGIILSWDNANNSLPQTRYWGSLAQKGNRVYILGGASLSASGVYVDTSYSSTIQTDGTLSDWQTFAPLPQKLGLGAAAIVGDRIYFAGGFNSDGRSQKVYSAPINSDGSLGTWIDAGNLPVPQEGFSMIEHNGHLIMIGGANSSAVYKTTPDANGIIPGWESTTSFPTPIYRASAIKVGTTLLVIGGHDGSTTTNNIYFTTIHDDGTLDPWTLSGNHLPSPVHGASLSLVNDYIYLMGGYNSNNGSYLNSVYFTKLNITPPDNALNVPLLKQTNPSWGNLLYDTANLWAPLGKRSISDWGCALTSAAMVFQYHGITKMPDGRDLNPGSLNTWLKNQPGGYVNQGWVAWPVLGKLVKLAKNQNPQFTYDTLEYLPTPGYDSQFIKNNLQNNKPVILAEPGHFIVAKGTSGNTFTINDPGFSRLTLQEYGDTASAMGTYIPSNSDLSYIEMVVDNGVTISVTDADGNTISGISYTQSPIQALTGNITNDPPLLFYYIPKPAGGKYTVKLSSSSTNSYSLQTLLLDQDGNVNFSTQKGILGNNLQDILTIKFNKDNSKNSTISQNVSFDSLLADLDLLFSQKLIKLGIYTAMKAEALAAQKMSLKSKVSAKAVLLAVSKELDILRGKSITEKAYQILKPEVVALRGTL